MGTGLIICSPRRFQEKQTYVFLMYCCSGFQAGENAPFCFLLHIYPTHATNGQVFDESMMLPPPPPPLLPHTRESSLLRKLAVGPLPPRLVLLLPLFLPLPLPLPLLLRRVAAIRERPQGQQQQPPPPPLPFPAEEVSRRWAKLRATAATTTN